MRWVCLAVLLSLPGLPQPAGAVDGPLVIAVRVHGVRSGGGQLVAELYRDQPDGFLRKSGRLARERVPAHQGSVALQLPAPRAGRYAVAVYHDENGNGKFDRSAVGLPREGFGLSNNPRLGPWWPRFADAAFDVAAPATVEIDLRY